MTVHEYDGDGRLVRSVTSREPSWTEQDRAEILALAAWRASLCPCGCGHPTAETTSHEEGGPQFRASRTVCRARLALLEEQAALEDKKSRHTQARLWRVEMIER